MKTGTSTIQWCPIVKIVITFPKKNVVRLISNFSTVSKCCTKQNNTKSYPTSYQNKKKNKISSLLSHVWMCFMFCIDPFDQSASSGLVIGN